MTTRSATKASQVSRVLALLMLGLTWGPTSAPAQDLPKGENMERVAPAPPPTLPAFLRVYGQYLPRVIPPDPNAAAFAAGWGLALPETRLGRALHEADDRREPGRYERMLRLLRHARGVDLPGPDATPEGALVALHVSWYRSVVEAVAPFMEGRSEASSPYGSSAWIEEARALRARGGLAGRVGRVYLLGASTVVWDTASTEDLVAIGTEILTDAEAGLPEVAYAMACLRTVGRLDDGELPGGEDLEEILRRRWAEAAVKPVYVVSSLLKVQLARAAREGQTDACPVLTHPRAAALVDALLMAPVCDAGAPHDPLHEECLHGEPRGFLLGALGACGVDRYPREPRPLGEVLLLP